jgi:putative membrane protein
VACGIYGYLSWRFTYYTIDQHELRINSGIITKKSRRIGYERIQSVDISEPFLARLFGLAALNIEMAGGSDSNSVIRYLPLAEIRDMRTDLLRRANGERAADDVEGPTLSVEADREVILRVDPATIIIGALLSLDFMASLLIVVAIVTSAIWFGEILVAVGGLVPSVSWLAQLVVSRVIEQWNYTLSTDPRGLRIERGLLAKTARTIPVDRVQGIVIKEPFIWRRFGWRRLEVSVAGANETQGNDSLFTVFASPILLPIGTKATADDIIERLIPGALARVEPTRASSRSWIFAPIGWRYRWAGANPAAFVAAEGWVQRTRNLVPHARVQSAEFKQGPIQRALGVATAKAHSPDGPVQASARHVQAESARTLALQK